MGGWLAASTPVRNLSAKLCGKGVGYLIHKGLIGMNNHVQKVSHFRLTVHYFRSVEAEKPVATAWCVAW